MTQGWPSRLWDLENPPVFKGYRDWMVVFPSYGICAFWIWWKVVQWPLEGSIRYTLFSDEPVSWLEKHAFLMHFTAWIWCKHLKNLGFDANKNLGFWWRLMRGVWIWHAYHSQIVINYALHPAAGFHSALPDSELLLFPSSPLVPTGPHLDARTCGSIGHTWGRFL